MKKNFFTYAFITTHICFVVLLIYKNSKIIQLTYQKQTIEMKKKERLQTKEQLTQNIAAAYDQGSIKEFALTQLHMVPVQLQQIKKIAT